MKAQGWWETQSCEATGLGDLATKAVFCLLTASGFSWALCMSPGDIHAGEWEGGGLPSVVEPRGEGQ